MTEEYEGHSKSRTLLDSEKNYIVKIKEFIQLLPFFTFLIILANIVKLNIFYNYYSIAIFDYITIGELLLGLMTDLFTIFLFFGFFVVTIMIEWAFNVPKNG